MNIVLIAAPAAGKGTQAAMLKEEYNLYHLSTGDLLREIAATDTELGKEVKSKIDNGILIDDELMLKLLKEKISSLVGYNGFIFDGFPRTINQADMLGNLLKEMNQKVDYVFFLEVQKEIAMKRAVGRVTCPQCGGIFNTYFDTFKEAGKCPNCEATLVHREDDTEEKFNLRFDTYIEKTQPLVEYYKNLNLLNVIKCSDIKEETYKMIKEIIEK